LAIKYTGITRKQVLLAITSYSDTGLTPSTQYTYKVSAYDNAGNVSSQSSVASATTLSASSTSQGDTTIPSTPTNLSATVVSSTTINLTWTASTDNVSVIGYEVYRDNSQIGTTSTTSYSDKKLTASTSYLYKITAYDGSGM